ncbi:hypothetical protein FQA39_LY16913 [Lamprigera yunnana]|nr:hypothetical protein FQA39_LY16913 [Lamprigera yunnana]
MKQSQNQTLQDFEILKAETNNKPTKAQIKQFVWDHFEKGNELENHNLTDFNPNPAFISKISNETVKEFAQKLLNIWPQLARKVKDEVHSNVDRYSLIPIPNAFIVPGGRFLEYYYWDSYWIIEGLLVSEMNKTARGMIDNFLSLVNEYGFIPNGGRIYYLRRSQPPLLTAMAFLYYQHSNDLMWIKNNIQILAKELNYWRGKLLYLTKNGKTYSMYHYHAVSSGPRPESYREDYETSSYFSNETKRTEVYIDLKSAAESGWDFSSRWIFDDNGDTAANLSFIQTKRVIPVDLNAFLCGAFRSISKLYKILHYPVEYLKWKNRFHLLRKAIREVLWNDQDSVWYDYDIDLSRPRKKFYPSNLTPLWSMCFDEAESHQLGVSAVKYLRKNDILDYTGGVPTSRDETGQQWDFPNAWAPLLDIVISGLETTGSPTALEEANVLAKRWINSNIIGYRQTGAMFEKYNAIVPGKYGSGGEYEVQSGFVIVRIVDFIGINSWSPVEIDSLITLVSERRDLYDQSSSAYSNLNTTDTLWRQISSQYRNRNEQELRKKWQILRTGYRTRRGEKYLPSGFGAKQIKKWVYFDSLMFLEPYMTERNTSTNLKKVSNNTTNRSLCNNVSSQSYAKAYMLNDDGILVSDELEESDQNTEEYNSQTNPHVDDETYSPSISDAPSTPEGPTSGSRKKRKSKLNPVDERFLTFFEKKHESTAKREKSSNELFLASLLKDMNKLQQDDLRKFKIIMLSKLGKFLDKYI